MKKFLLPILFTFFLLSCNQTNKPSDKVAEEGTTKDVVAKEPLLKQYIDAYLAKNRDCFNNKVSEEECSKAFASDFLLTQLGDSIPCISELPLILETTMAYNDDKYVVKFGFGKHTSRISLSKEYDTYFQVFSIVDKNTVLSLKEKELYYVKGACHSYANKKSFTLPSGKYFDDPARLYKIGDEINLNLGTLIITKASFIPVEKN